MISQIISEAEQAEAEAITAENEAQAAYAEMVKTLMLLWQHWRPRLQRRPSQSPKREPAKKLQTKILWQHRQKRKALMKQALRFTKVVTFFWRTSRSDRRRGQRRSMLLARPKRFSQAQTLDCDP